MISITKETMDELIQNQKDCKNIPPETRYACFQLKEVKDLIQSIEDSDQYKNLTNSNPANYEFVVVFLRDEMQQNGTKIVYDKTKVSLQKSLSGYTKKENGKEYTQVIPVLAGCICRLDDEKIPNFFELIHNKDNSINIVTPGGEGTGLIPPPKTIK